MVVAPLTGLYYTAPSPDAAPYVRVGGPGRRRPGHRAHRGHEAVQRDQERHRRARACAWRPRTARWSRPSRRSSRSSRRERREATGDATGQRQDHGLGHVRAGARADQRRPRAAGRHVRRVDRSRTGIRERRVAAPARDDRHAGRRWPPNAPSRWPVSTPTTSTSSWSATLTPDYWMPSTAALVKEAIGNRARRPWTSWPPARASSTPTPPPTPTSAPACTAMCSSVGAELLTRFLDFTDRNTCILFGDGAGAVVVSASDEEGGGMGGLELTTDPDGAYMIWLPSGGSRSPASPRDDPARRALRAHGRQGDLPLRDQDAGHVGVDGHRTRRLDARRDRPVHPAPGQHPDHRVGRQGTRASRWTGCS